MARRGRSTARRRSAVGAGRAKQPVPLSQLIDVVNERFGTDFNQADQLFFDQIVEAAMADDGLRQAAAVNPEDKFELVFKQSAGAALRRAHGPERGDLRPVS